MITKAQVIEMYQASKQESEKLLELMLAEKSDDPGFQENLELIKLQIKMIDLIIEAIDQDEHTQEELQHHFNRAISFGITDN